jgi:hypothetical protein
MDREKRRDDPITSSLGAGCGRIDLGARRGRASTDQPFSTRTLLTYFTHSLP